MYTIMRGPKQIQGPGVGGGWWGLRDYCFKFAFFRKIYCVNLINLYAKSYKHHSKSLYNLIYM